MDTGRTASREGRTEAAADALHAALALWRGPALDGLNTPLLRNEARRLDELRLQVLEERVHADLARGRSHVLTDELSAAVLAHPLRERLRAYLMLALYRSGRHFPDGQLYADLKDIGGTGVSRTVDVLGGFLRALGVEEARLPDGVDERSALLRTTLSGRRLLLLLDDASSEEQVRPLLAAHAGAAVIITSRTHLSGIEGRAQLALEALEPDDALVLLGRLAGAERVAAEPDAAREIVQMCDRLPLALRTVGARLASRQRWPLAVLAARLRDEHRRLDEMVAGDLAVRATLNLTYSSLADPLRVAFQHLGMLGVPEFSSWVLAGLLGLPVAKAEYLADRLNDAQLLDCYGVDEHGQLRYRIHDLVRLFARERADAENGPSLHAEAIGRLIDTVLQMFAGAPRSAAGPSAPAMLLGERRALVVAVERASELGLADHACRLSTMLLSTFQARNGFAEWSRTHDCALAAARAAGQRRNEAILTLGVGKLRFEQDRLADAEDLDRAEQDLTRAREQFDRLDFPLFAARVQRDLAEVRRRAGDLAAARRLHAAALATFAAAGSREHAELAADAVRYAGS